MAKDRREQMIEWATIIYGRTVHHDFRLLVKPDGFGTDETKWAERHILALLRSEEKLRKGERWAVFKNEKYCVVGVGCMAVQLSADMNKDPSRRNLYAFVGVVSKGFSGIPAMEIEPFKKLYEKYVRPRWLDKYPSAMKAQQVADEYPSHYEEQLNLLTTTQSQGLEWNIDSTLVRLFPDSEEQRQKLWHEAAHQASLEKNFSLGIRLARKKDVVEKGRFLNVSVVGLEKESLESIIDTSQKRPHTEEVLNTEQTQTDSHQEKLEQVDVEYGKSPREQTLDFAPVVFAVGTGVVFAFVGISFFTCSTVASCIKGFVGGGFVGGSTGYLAGTFLKNKLSSHTENEDNTSNISSNLNSSYSSSVKEDEKPLTSRFFRDVGSSGSKNKKESYHE